MTNREGVSMDTATITLIAGIISCIIGVSSFVSGRMAKAEQNGSMETKINQALEGIAAINRKLEDSAHEQHETDLLVRSHDEQIHTLFNTCAELRSGITSCSNTYEILKSLLQTLKEE